MAILSLWWAYKQGIVELVDVRVWLAAFEVKATRCRARDNRRRRFMEHELAKLVGATDKRVRSSLRRLERAGFLWWSERAIRFGCGAEGFCEAEFEEVTAFVHSVENHRRKVPLPRSVLKLSCRSTRPVFIATVLGHALRCMYYRNSECCPDGRCKASWIADKFGIDVRNVKAARRELAQLGALIMDPINQRSMNRFGPRVRFNLAWQPERLRSEKSPPRAATKSTQLPPPYKNRELVSRSWNQEPAERGPTGACAAESGTSRLKFERVTPRDLAEPERIAEFYLTAVRQRLIRHSESERLNVFTAAEHAKTYGTTNPCGMFVWLVKNRRWDLLTMCDEDCARNALRGLEERIGGRWPDTGTAPSRRNGSASDAARGASPEAARRLLAGTGCTDYPILGRLTASLNSWATTESLKRA